MKINNYSHIKPIILFLIIAIIHTLFSVGFNFSDVIVNWQDMSQPLNPLLFLEKSLYVWVNTFPWGINSWVTTYLFYALPIYLINGVVDNIVISINIFWIFLQFTFLYSYYLLFQNLFNNKIKYGIYWSLLLYYSINTINILQFATVFVDYAWFIWIPLLFYSFRKFIFEKKNSYILLFIFAEILLFRPTSIFFIANLAILVYFILQIYLYIKNKEDFQKLIRMFSLGIVCILILILPAFSLLLSAQRFLDNSNFQAYTSSWLSRTYQDWYSLFRVLRLNWCSTCHQDSASEFPNLVYFNYTKIYNNSPFYILISLIPLLVILSWLLYRREQKEKNKYIPIFLLVLILLFFAKSINPPFASFNEYFRQLPVFWIFFRSGAKYFMFFAVPLIIFLWLQILQKNKNYKKLAWLYIIAHMILIYVIHSPTGTYWKSTIPDTYNWIVKQINTLPNLTNTLVLPIVNHRLDGQMYYRDWYAWSNRTKSLSNSPLIYSSSIFWSSEWYKEYFTDISKGRNQIDNYDAITQNMEKLWYSYILVEKNAISYPRIDITKPQATWEMIYSEIIKRPESWKIMYENEDFALFEWNEMYSIFRSDNMKVKKNNPTNYDINITIDDDTNLDFLQSYHPDWKLYLRPYSEISCNTSINYIKNQGEELSGTWFIKSQDNFNVTECKSESIFYTWWELWRLQETSVFSDSHTQLYNYANSWKLDKNFIINNYSKEYYKLNNDWTIDVRFNLYFKSQSYFYILMLLSIATISFVVLWVVFTSIIWRKKLRKHKNI